jgi:stage II sporulation protein D
MFRSATIGRGLAAVSLAALVVGAGLGSGPAAAAVPVLVFDGKGWGHGVGLAQDGALAMGRAGAKTNQILGQFYPGSSLAKAGGTVRVAVADPSADQVVGFPQGGEVDDSPGGTQSTGFPVRVGPGGTVHLRLDAAGRYQVVGAGGTASGTAPGSGSTQAAAAVAPAPAPAHAATPAQQPAAAPAQQPAAPAQAPAPAQASPFTLPTLFPPPPSPTTTTPPGATTTTPPAAGGGGSTTTPPTSTTTPGSAPASAGPTSTRPLWAVPAGGGVVAVAAKGRTYRGAVEALGASGGLRLVNVTDVEHYLDGMGEVRDPSWPAASLQAQAIASRTYALRAMAASGEICDTTRCQVYLGAQAEYQAMNQAVASTAGVVLAYGGGLADTVFSANGGGFSASPEEGFGTSGASYPYLRAAPYRTQDPRPWQVPVALSDVAARLGYHGQLTGARISTTGPSSRAVTVELDGSNGPTTVSGLAVASALGLRSTLFTLAAGSAGVAPPPPPVGSALQQPPDAITPALAGSPDGGAQPVSLTPGRRGVLGPAGTTRTTGRARAAAVVVFALLLVPLGAATASAAARRAGGAPRILRWGAPWQLLRFWRRT